MVPDILGYELDEGLKMLAASGYDSGNVIVDEYLSPKKDKIGCSQRILRVDMQHDTITLTISYF